MSEIRTHYHITYGWKAVCGVLARNDDVHYSGTVIPQGITCPECACDARYLEDLYTFEIAYDGNTRRWLEEVSSPRWTAVRLDDPDV